MRCQGSGLLLPLEPKYIASYYIVSGNVRENVYVHGLADVSWSILFLSQSFIFPPNIHFALPKFLTKWLPECLPDIHCEADPLAGSLAGCIVGLLRRRGM